MDGCAHYIRRCRFVSPCCNKIYTCRFCHNENETHEINRFEIKEIVCSKCDCRQVVSNECTNCGVVFGKYFCNICNLFDDRVEREYFHCVDCGICRISEQTEFVHCHECKTCMVKKHKCIKDVFDCNCPVCLENLFHSTKHSCTLQCGHSIHIECFHECIKNNNLFCSICRKIVISGDILKEYIKNFDDLIKEYPIQEELLFRIKCNDCSFHGEVVYHPYGMKCKDCGGYNTMR